MTSVTPTAATPPIFRGLQAALPPALLSYILSSRILLIGSGGIGCELLKNLALSGFRHVDVIDLDTIDVSNLNRQFLFRARHVGLPKCQVASEAAMQMIPPYCGEEAEYKPHHGNILDNTLFHVPYVRSFSLVLNALDNVAARRRVNRLCLAAGVPLIEAGTAGYLGQVTVIDKSAGVECYECQTKSVPKVYPICTIRSTPSMPVHCIVWAKELYKLCFHGNVEESMLFEDEESLRAEKDFAAENDSGEGTDAGSKIMNNEKSTDTTTTANVDSYKNDDSSGEKSTYMDSVNELRSLLRVGSSTPQSKDENFNAKLRLKAQQALTALFATEIDKQVGMNRFKTAEKVPISLSSSDLEMCSAPDILPPTERSDYKPTQIWSPSDCLVEIVSCLLHVSNSSTPPLPEFDKDDDMAMRFVTAASNLRSYVFQIEPIQSLYSAKGIAGNIIPAIATTNAIVAGLQVLQAFHILKCQLMQKSGEGVEVGRGIKSMCRYTYLLRERTRKGYLIQPTTLPDPNPNCFVCRNAIISLALNTKEWTLDILLTRVIKKELGFSQPTILIGDDIIYEEGDDIDPSEFSANLSKKLISLPSGGIGHGSVIRIEDFTQDLEVEVTVSHKDEWVIVEEAEENGAKKEIKKDDREESEKFEIGGHKPIISNAVSSSNGDAAAVKSNNTEEADDDEIELVEQTDAEIETQSKNHIKNFMETTECITKVCTNSDETDMNEELNDNHAVSGVDAYSTVEDDNNESRMPLKKRRLSHGANMDAKKVKISDRSDPTGNGEHDVIEIDSD